MSSRKKISLKIIKKPEDDLDDQPESMPNERDRISKVFVNLLKPTLGRECESEVYRYVRELTNLDFLDPKFKRRYLSLAYNLIENLDPEGSIGNDYLRPQVMEGQIEPKELVRMNDQELYPVKWQKIKEKRLTEIKAENEQNVATTDLYKCGKCHKRECTYFQLQTRSADEPITTFINCINCGKRWKE